MDLAQATNATETIELCGAEYPVRQLKMKEWGQFQAWLKRAYPSPLTRAVETMRQEKDAGTPLDAATSDQLLDHAQRASLSWPPRVNSQEWYEAIDATEGAWARVVETVLTLADPSFPIAKADEIADRMTLEELLDLTSMVLYGTRRDKKKAPTSAAVPAPSPGPSRSPTTGETSSPS